MDKQTFLHAEQVLLNAKMVPFAGWEMPLQYSGIIDEVKTVREDAGLFDVSHMGEVFVHGDDALPFLQKLVPQDVSKLRLNKAIYCQLTNMSGGIIDDLIIYKLGEKEYLLIVNASRIDEDLNWIVRSSLGFSVSIDNNSHKYSLLALQGPKAPDLIESMGLKKDLQPEFFTIKRAEFNNVDVLISRTGYTGEDGFEILIENEFSQNLWKFILEKGEEFSIKPIGLGARDVLRLEAGLHLYGNDLTENTTPIEAGLNWSVSKTKQDFYFGQEVILEQLKNGVGKKFIAFKMIDRAIPRHDYEIYIDGSPCGIVTSGGFSPTLNENIGMGYVNVKTLENLTIANTIEIMVRNKLYKAQIVKRPFVDKKNRI